MTDSALLKTSYLIELGCLTIPPLDIADIPDYIRHGVMEPPVARLHSGRHSDQVTREQSSSTTVSITSDISKKASAEPNVDVKLDELTANIDGSFRSKKRKKDEIGIYSHAASLRIPIAGELGDNVANFVENSTDDDWLESAALAKRNKPKLKQSKISFGKRV